MQSECAKCELSLMCLMERSFDVQYYCMHCEGIWVCEEDLLIQCAGYYGMVHHHLFTDRCANCNVETTDELRVIEGYHNE